MRNLIVRLGRERVHPRIVGNLQVVVIVRRHAVQYDLIRAAIREVGRDAEGRAVQRRSRIRKGQRALSCGSRTRRGRAANAMLIAPPFAERWKPSGLFESDDHVPPLRV